MLSYIEVDCPGCLAQLSALSSVVAKESNHDAFVLVSPANADRLERLMDEYGLLSVVLWDDGRLFAESLRLPVSPFNVVIDPGMVVREVHAFPLDRNDLAAFLKRFPAGYSDR